VSFFSRQGAKVKTKAQKDLIPFAPWVVNFAPLREIFAETN
jgi:hypothetical protein